MLISIKKGEIIFRNPQIFAVDTKAINLDRVLTNLYMLIYSNGAPLLIKERRTEHTMESLMDYIAKLEERGLVIGAKENRDAIEDWLRSNLVDMVFRGNMVKEKVASLRPMHLMSYRVQNKRYNRDYNTSDQLYIMLRNRPEVLQGLKNYLCQGWDTATNSLVNNGKIDVDTAGILYMTQGIKEQLGVNTETSTIKPFLEKQSDLFCDDIRSLLVYQDKLPRSVFIEYLRILCGFHLGLYIMKLVYFLPKMVDAGTRNIPDDWSLIVDVTDRLDSGISQYACADLEKFTNSYRDYVKATFIFNVVQKRLWDAGNNPDSVLAEIKKGIDKSDGFYEARLSTIRDKYIADHSDEADADKTFDEILQYFPKDDYFDKYIYMLESSNIGELQVKFMSRFTDNCCMKNSNSMLLADGRSKRYPRRGALGSKLLETLVQLLVLQQNTDGTYYTRTLSIDELTKMIYQRYGLIINGADSPRFTNADVNTNAAFKDNIDAFKNKLRQIGFYTDLSDATILQKIHPRYKID